MVTFESKIYLQIFFYMIINISKLIFYIFYNTTIEDTCHTKINNIQQFQKKIELRIII